MQLVHSLTTALPLSRLTAYKPKGHYHTFGEPPSAATLSSSISQPSSSRALPRTSTSAHAHKHADPPHSVSHTANHPPLQTKSAQEHNSQFPPDLPNAARLNAHINPQPSTTVLEISVAFPATTYYLTTIAPEVNLHPGDKNQPSVYLSGSLVVSGSTDTTATAPDVIMGGSWEGIVASSSMSSRLAVVATASVSLPDTKTASTSSGVLVVDVPTPSVTASVSFGSIEPELITSSISKPLMTSRSVASSVSTVRTSTLSGPTSGGTTSGSSSSSNIGVSSGSSRGPSSSTESTATSLTSGISASTSTSSDKVQTPTTSASSNIEAENTASHWWRFRGRRNDEEGIYLPSRETNTHSESHPTETADKTASFTARIMLGHSEVLPVAPVSPGTTTKILATSINELCERQTGGSTYECPEVLTNGSY